MGGRGGGGGAAIESSDELNRAGGDGCDNVTFSICGALIEVTVEVCV